MSAAAGRSVLVVDDNVVNRKLACLVMASGGYHVRSANDGEAALAAVAESHPDLILMDIQMPGLDGYAVTRILKGDPATRHIVVVALTAYAMKQDQELAREAGCDAYITKPIDTRSFARQVATLLGAVARPPTEAA